jgi:ABC-type branched-subunit amino acid transport system ATPase component
VLFGRQRVRGEQPLVALFGFGLRRREDQHHREAALRVLEYVGLAAKAGTQAKNLSYAEQKLLSLARILATDSALLLLDEPASGLDRHSVQTFNELIRDLSRAGKTILLVEHNFAIIRAVSDHVVFLDHGEVVAEGTPETVVKDSRLTEIYFGTFFGGRRRPDVVTGIP